MMATANGTSPAAALYGPWDASVALTTPTAVPVPEPRQSVPPRGTPGRGRRPVARRCEGECGRTVARSSRTGLCRECRARVNAPVPCTGKGCTAAREAGQPGSLVSPKLKTGQCRACWRASRGTNGAKTDPQEQAEMLYRLVRSFARRCEGEDPGLGLAALMGLAGKVDDLVDAVGMALCAEQGTSAVAADLGWDRRRADKRWGPEARRERGWQA